MKAAGAIAVLGAAMLFSMPCLHAEAASPPAPAQQDSTTQCSPVQVAEGCGTFSFPDGTKYVGRFHGGFMNGSAKISFADGSILEGDFRRDGGARDSVTYTTSSGERIVGPFEDASPDLAHPNKPIDYPFWRAFFHDSKNVYVVIVLDESGAVRAAALLQPIDSPSYTQAAIEGVMQWHYLPATIGGKPVKCLGVINIQFATAH